MFNFQENIGTSTNPNFNTPALNPFGLSIIPNDPAFIRSRNFVDLDGDGDFDILANVVYYGVGAWDTKYRYYENIGKMAILLTDKSCIDEDDLNLLAGMFSNELNKYVKFTDGYNMNCKFPNKKERFMIKIITVTEFLDKKFELRINKISVANLLNCLICKKLQILCNYPGTRHFT